MKKTTEQFQSIVQDAKANPDILGCVLVGSRGKGFENEYSDYDALLVARDGVAKKLKDQFERMTLPDIDLVVVSLAEYKTYAAWGGADEWDRYDYAHAKVLVDKSGVIKKLTDEKGKIPKKVLKRFVACSLDGYINAVFRSVKCIRNKNQAGARLEAASSIPFLLDVVFGLNGRVKPFFGYLEREMKEYPLKKFPWRTADFVRDILSILETADLKTQQELLKAVERLARKEGFGKVFDAWEGKDRWAMEFKK